MLHDNFDFYVSYNDHTPNNKKIWRTDIIPHVNQFDGTVEHNKTSDE